MKKNLKLIVFTVVLCAVSALNVKVVLDTEHSSDLAMTSLAAIGEGNSGEGGSSEGGGIIDWWDRKDYTCISVTCECITHRYKSTYAEYKGDGKGDVAYMWNCKGCGDCGFIKD